MLRADNGPCMSLCAGPCVSEFMGGTLYVPFEIALPGEGRETRAWAKGGGEGKDRKQGVPPSTLGSVPALGRIK